LSIAGELKKRAGRGLIRAIVSGLTLLAVAATAHSYEKVEAVGDVATVVVAVAAGGMPLLLQDREGMLQLVKAAAVDLTTTMALKYAVHERRPDGEDNRSFPSAHSSVSFTAAEYLRKRFGWEYGLPAYGLATFVACSRVEAEKHHVHDVLAGAAIGIASSYLFTTPNPHFTLQTAVESGYFGVRLTKVW
jgi:membrane-associated phospholipid phosphatase